MESHEAMGATQVLRLIQQGFEQQAAQQQQLVEAIRQHLQSVFVSVDECWTRGCDVEAASCLFFDFLESLGFCVRSDP